MRTQGLYFKEREKEKKKSPLLNDIFVCVCKTVSQVLQIFKLLFKTKLFFSFSLQMKALRVKEVREFPQCNANIWLTQHLSHSLLWTILNYLVFTSSYMACDRSLSMWDSLVRVLQSQVEILPVTLPLSHLLKKAYLNTCKR